LGTRRLVLVVTNPDRGSLDVAAHSVAVSHDLKADRVIVIANRVEGADDLDTIRRSLPDMPMVEVPEDAAIGAAERHGRSVVDTVPGCPAVAAIQALALRLVANSDGGYAARR
jgi:MinD-like ATPase involved in chromosome partitioning or flagellar assembly